MIEAIEVGACDQLGRRPIGGEERIPSNSNSLK